MISVVNRHPLVTFFVLAYGFSWGNFVLSRAWPIIPFLFPYGPMLAAVVVAGITCGRDGLKDILGRCLLWRVGLKWYAAALFVPIIIALAAVSLMVLYGKDTSSAQEISWSGLLLLFPVALIDAPLGEESGWRGYALPRFPASRSPLENTLILGVLLAGWHLPVALAEGSIAAPYLIATVASAFVTNWVYYNANESALLAIIYHTTANTMGMYFFPSFSGPDLAQLFWLLAAVNCVVAAILLLVAPGRISRASQESSVT